MTTVQFDQVSKKFLLHRQRSRSLQELFLGLFNRQGRPRQEPYWALRDVSFEVGAGEKMITEAIDSIRELTNDPQ